MHLILLLRLLLVTHKIRRSIHVPMVQTWLLIVIIVMERSLLMVMMMRRRRWSNWIVHHHSGRNAESSQSV